MTYREAIEAIKCNYPDAHYSILREALDMSMELLEKADKHRWHDLRKDPKDLPEERDSIFAKFYGTEKWKSSFFRKVSDEVIVCFEAPTGERIEKQVQSHDGQFNFPYHILHDMRAIAWHYTEPFEEIEE